MGLMKQKWIPQQNKCNKFKPNRSQSDQMRSPQRLRSFKVLYGLGYGLMLLLLVVIVNKIFNPVNGDPEQLNKAIDEKNNQYAKGNRFGFTDKERTTQKPHGIYRIAVLGDSYEKVWSHKLEKKLLAEYDSIEVIHWGLNGWSTLDEFNFFKSHGKDYDVDLLIIAWVDNDPDMGNIPPVHALDPAIEMPVLDKVCPPLAEAWVGHKEDVAYAAWIEKIYGKQNVDDYQKLLIAFKAVVDSTHTRTLCVMTPGPFDNDERDHFKLMEPIIKNSGTPCFNLYPVLSQKLKHYSNKELIANPVNGHPGEIMTEAMADEVETYLKENHYIPPSKKR